MAVYVDDMYLYPIGEFRNMKMSHMIADTTDELLAMVDKIGVARKWIQYPGRHKEHFDIAISKRTLALRHGAIAISYPQCAAMSESRRVLGILGSPHDAEEWLREQHRQRHRTEP